MENQINSHTLFTVLRDDCLPKLGLRAKYFSLNTIRQWLKKEKLSSAPATITRYLHDLVGRENIFGSGRGWYSSLAKPFELNRQPVSSLVQELNQTFPLLEFSCWSTEQIAGYGHHLLAKFVSFVYVDRDSLPSVFESLRDRGFDVHLNPRGAAARQFTVRERTIVLRPKVTTQPTDSHFVTIEGLLVELHIESRALNLLDSGEYSRIFNNATRTGRVSMGSLAEYAGKRKTAAKDLLKSINGEFLKNSLLIDLKLEVTA